MERRVEVFFYGLFMDADALREKGFHPANVRLASVDDMALRLGERATLDRLYSEPSVAANRPEPVGAMLSDGRSIAVLCFNLPAVPAGVQSNADYAAKLRIVARRLGLPESCIASIGLSQDTIVGP